MAQTKTDIIINNTNADANASSNASGDTKSNAKSKQPAKAKLRFKISNAHCLIGFFIDPLDKKQAGQTANLSNQQACWALQSHIEAMQGVLEVVPGMNALTVYTHALSLPELHQLQKKLNALDISQFVGSDDHQDTDDIIKIPVIYGGEAGPDLVDSAKRLGMTPAELVEAHTQPIYTVYFMGFQPGFPYLGGLPEHLHLPRHANPRTKVPAGSVGIGGQQTGVYPFASPGGWQLLGRTDEALFDIHATPPTRLQAGDRLQFVATKILDDKAVD